MRRRPWQIVGQVYAVLFSVVMLAPMLIVLFTSFTDEGYIRFPQTNFGVRWYVAAFANSAFMSALVFSIKVATIVAVVSGLLGVTAAIALASPTLPGRSFLIGAATLPLTLPHIVLAIALLQLFGMLAMPTAPYAIVAGHVMITAPYVLRLTVSALSGLDPRLELASHTLGASRFRTFVKIIIPLGARGIAAGVLFAFLISFDEVTIALFAASPGKMTLPAEIFSYASQGADPVIAAASGIMILISCLFVVLIEWSFGVLQLIIGESKKGS